ncbi:hypothetical protein F2P81_005096 [Scophthalmus maximus]|uniref:STIL N-terminal domain-containing protein n=1 Tax=Scophthalmus maximus TaxID=52904 RepID=A0A6A4TEC5_SCOMX|nr:hypothetical protein F2P81_005096 [Scophthalmus maximus]
MSCPVKLQDLPTTLFEQVFTPENVRGRRSTNSLTPLSFPKSRSALWDGSAAGDKFRLQLCSHRKPHVVLLEKALRLAQRHVRHSNKPRLECFFLGSVSVDADEEGVTVTLDRFDPGRDQAVSSGGRVPSALLPGDVLVPCLFSTQREATPDAVVQSEAELHHCFKQSDVAAISLSWSLVCPSVSVDVQPVRAVPIIPTALLRSLTSVGRPQHHHTAGRQRGFVTMDQTRKLLLLLESDPKASNLPLVGLVLSESGCFLLVLFAATHRAPQFYQCRGPGPRPGPGLQLDCELLTAFQSVTLYQPRPSGPRPLCHRPGLWGRGRGPFSTTVSESSRPRSAGPDAAGGSGEDSGQHSDAQEDDEHRCGDRRKQQSPGDAVVSATLRQLQQLGVDMDQEDLTESERNRVRTVESTRLSVSNPTVSSLFPGGSSVDLSLEANAIALRYLSDSQLSRLAVGGHTPRRGPASSSSSTDFLLSPSNMSLATRKYMRRYGLIEEEDSEDEDEQEEDVGVQEASTTRQVLTDAPVVNLLPQSQLIRDLQPKMQLLARNTKPNAGGKENCSSRRPSLVRASSHQTEGSVGNILDLSRLRELPKLF